MSPTTIKAAWQGSYAATFRRCGRLRLRTLGCAKYEVPRSLRSSAGHLYHCNTFDCVCHSTVCRKGFNVDK